MSLFKRFLLCLGLCFWVHSTPLLAQGTGEGGEYGSGGEYSGDGNTTGRSPASQISTVDQIATRLSTISALCSKSGGYAVDCLAERLEAIEKDASTMGGYSDMRQILRETAEELRLLARSNRDPSKPRARLQNDDGDVSSRPLVTVAPSRRRSTQAQALKVLQNAETKLLRSSTQSADRASQYRQVAQALGSNKVLLRS